MSITPSQIATSVGQAALQQRQAARVMDGAQNAAARSSHRLRQLTTEHMESVEDFYETTDDPLAVKRRSEDQPGSGRGQSDQAPSDDQPSEPPQHIDLTA